MKGKLYLLIGLVVLFGYGGYQMYKRSAAARTHLRPRGSSMQGHAGFPAPAGPEAQASNTGLDPLHLERLALNNRSSTRAPAEHLLGGIDSAQD
jgi:hypothetical protein